MNSRSAKPPTKSNAQRNAPRSPALADSHLADLISRRIINAGLSITPAEHIALLAYVQHLALWNRTINLTAFDLETPTADAIDRLVAEPWIAARAITPDDHLLIDIGSGAGSPALPMKIAAPWLRMVLVESKTRKATFLRDAIRQLGLPEVDVDARRAEKLLTRTDVIQSADVVTVRAVRMDAALSRTIAALLRPGGRLFWFGAPEPAPDLAFPLTIHTPKVSGGVVAIYRRTA